MGVPRIGPPPSAGSGGTVPATTVAASGASQAVTAPAHGEKIVDVTLTANCAFTLSGGTAGEACTVTLLLRQDATAGRTPSFPVAVAWPGQITPSLNVGAGKYDVVSLTTLDGGVTWTGALVASAVQPVTAPQAPISLANGAGSGVIVVNWADAGNGGSPITNHKIYRGTTAGSETLLATVGAVSSYTDNAVTNGTTYYYRVTAVNSVGEGPQSAEIGATAGHYLNVTTGGASTPSTAAMVPGTNTVDLRALVAMTSWVPAGNQFLVAKYGSTTANNQYALYIDNAGKLNGVWYNAAGVFEGAPSTVPLGIPANGTKWVRALLNPGAGTITYYTSEDGTTWTQLGATVTGLTTTAVQTTASPNPLTIGQTGAGTGQFTGRIFRAKAIINAVEQASVDFTTATSGASTVTGAEGETWTVIAPAAIS